MSNSHRRNKAIAALTIAVACATVGFYSPFVRAAQPEPSLKREQVSQPTHEVKVERNVRIPMRDGVSLAAEIYRPDTPGRFPALMTLVYYPTGANEAQFFTRHGYACVVVNSRGRNGSQGEWEPYVNEPQDGYDTQQWIGRQPWCDGRIGMYGQSYNAFTQIASAPMATPT